MNVNYNFLVKLYSELNQDQKIKFNKNLQVASISNKVFNFWLLGQDSNLRPID